MDDSHPLTAHSPPLAPLSRRDLARLITGVENGDKAAMAKAHALYALSGRAHVIGVTGAPGGGKSTLISALAQAARQEGSTVAILSVDPSSAFTGGAILGDRIRMRELHADPGVFVRSMASRGALGGIASTTGDIAALLDAAGFDLILIETVGAGQSEIEVARVADTVIVVEAPGLGDDVQAIKAGILEVADVLVVNKADRDGVDATVGALRAALELGEATSGHHGVASMTIRTRTDAAADEPWTVPVLTTVATHKTGVTQLLAVIKRHRAYLINTGEGMRSSEQRARQQVLARWRDLLLQRAIQRMDATTLQGLIAACAARRLHPDEAARLLLEAAVD